jgi:hypothetical protein
MTQVTHIIATGQQPNPAQSLPFPRLLRVLTVGSNKHKVAGALRKYSSYKTFVEQILRDGTSPALATAMNARTPTDFNKALRSLIMAAGSTQGDVLRHDKATGNQLSKSTISRMVTGDKLCSRPEQIRAFVQACGADDEASMWTKTWRDLRDGKLPPAFATDRPNLKAPLLHAAGRAALLGFAFTAVRASLVAWIYYSISVALTLASLAVPATVQLWLTSRDQTRNRWVQGSSP